MISALLPACIVRPVVCSSLLMVLFLAVKTDSLVAQQEVDESRAPAFFKGYLELIEELDTLLATKTTYRFKVDGSTLVGDYNERLEADMQKTFVVQVKDLDVVGKNVVRIEFDSVDGVSNDLRVRSDISLSRLVVRMDEEEAYLVDVGSKVAIRGTPRIMFRPSPNQQISRAFRESVIAGWDRGGHTCFLLIDGAQGSRTE